jgi:DNA-binding transcriptional MerR regulator
MPPEGEGRGSHYTGKHLERLHELQKLSSQGVPLAKIKEYFDHGPVSHGPVPHGAILREVPVTRLALSEPKVTDWNRFELADGVELHVREGALTKTQRARIIQAMADVIKSTQSKSDEE